MGIGRICEVGFPTTLALSPQATGGFPRSVPLTAFATNQSASAVPFMPGLRAPLLGCDGLILLIECLAQ